MYERAQGAQVNSSFGCQDDNHATETIFQCTFVQLFPTGHVGKRCNLYKDPSSFSRKSRLKIVSTGHL